MFSAIFSPNYWILFFHIFTSAFFGYRLIFTYAECCLFAFLSTVPCVSLAQKSPSQTKNSPGKYRGCFFNLRPLAPYAQAHIAKPYR